MAKINIPFDNASYSIDESALSAASAALKSHLSTVMNGSGATINLGGTSYNVDSAKLSAVTSDFITHLGTIAGSGKKVVINGVEYNVDSTKMANAVTELHTVLGGLHTDDGDEGTLPEKNEYGFYYNVPYIGQFNGSTIALAFYENGTMLWFIDGNAMFNIDTDKLFVNDYSNFVYDESTMAVTNKWGIPTVFTEDGNSVTFMNEALQADAYNANILHGVYYDFKYVEKNGEIIVFAEDGSALHTVLDSVQSLTDIEWNESGHKGLCGDYDLLISMYGDMLIIINHANDDEKTVFERWDGESTMLIVNQELGATEEYATRLEEFVDDDNKQYLIVSGYILSGCDIKSLTVNGNIVEVEEDGSWMTYVEPDFDCFANEVIIIATDSLDNTDTVRGFVQTPK